MDVVRLEMTNYRPDSLVEGYTSMIWTERHIESGEFEMKTAKVAETRALLPEGSLISHRETNEVMFVESHTIGRDSDDNPELTVTGRTFDTFLENRVLLPSVYGESWSVYRQYKPSEMILLLLWMHLVNTTGEDPTRAATVMDNLVAIPNVVVTDSTNLTESAITWSLEASTVYDKIYDFLVLAGIGLRTVRPTYYGGYIVSFDTTRTTSRGTMTKTYNSNISDKLQVDIFNGTDRTRNQSTNEPVIFHYDSGHIDSPSYLFSSKNLKNMAKLYSSIGNQNVWPDTTPAPDQNVSGLNRRSLIVDGGSQGSQNLTDFTNAIIQKARIELKKHNRAVLFDGAISPLSPYKYNQHYSLGDKVTLLAQYGYEASMIVSEYVRTEDDQGDRGYPGLTLAV